MLTPLCANLAAGNYTEVAKLLPSKINLAIKQPPICDLIKVVGKGRLVVFLQIELVKLTERISIGNNINAAQLEFISTQLVEFFPGESLADFKICFERGCMGQYGEIFRMDGIVIRQWMEKYLDEKYQVIEEELKKSPDKMYQPSEVKTHDERHSEWLDKWQKEVGGVGNKVPAMTDQDVRRFGQEKPERHSLTAGYKYFDVNGKGIYATSQEHAEELAGIMMKNKIL